MVRQQQLSLFWCTNSLLFQLFSRWVYEKPYTHCLCFHSFSQYLKRNINNLLWAFSNSQNALWVNIFGNALNLVLHIHGIKKCIRNNDKLVLEMLKKSVTLRIQPVMYNVQIVHMCVWGGALVQASWLILKFWWSFITLTHTDVSYYENNVTHKHIFFNTLSLS